MCCLNGCTHFEDIFLKYQTAPVWRLLGFDLLTKRLYLPPDTINLGYKYSLVFCDMQDNVPLYHKLFHYEKKNIFVGKMTL